MTRWAWAFVLGFVACQPRPMVGDASSPSSASSSSPASSGDFAYRQYIDAVYNARNPEAIDQYFTANVVVHSVAPDVEGGTGTAYLKDLAKGLLDAFPDLHLTVDDVIQNGDHLAARVTVEGTQKGQFIGIAPTGHKVKVANFAMYRLEGGKIAEVWSLVDVAQLKLQLTKK